jgi:hypothetical protein
LAIPFREWGPRSRHSKLPPVSRRVRSLSSTAPGELLLRGARAHIPHYHEPGVQADPNRQRPACGFQLRQRLDDAQADSDPALGVVLVCARIAEIHQQAIPEILCDMSVVVRNDLGARRLIGAHQLAVFLGVEVLRKLGGSDQVAEQHSELAALGAGGGRFELRSRAAAGRCVPCAQGADCRLELVARPHRQA